MHDRLRLYPTLGKLVWVWAAGMIVQVAWWTIATQRKLAREQHVTRKKSDGDIATVAPHTTNGVTRQLAVQASDAPLVHRSLVWRKLSKQSLVLTLLVALTQATANTVLLYARTGAWLEQPYDWYSLRNTGARKYKATTPLPAQILSTCRFRNVSNAPDGLLCLDDVVVAAQHTQQMQATTAQLRKTAKTTTKDSATPSTRTVVYVVPYGANGVVELSERHVQPMRDASATAGLRTSTDRTRLHTTAAATSYERAAPVDELTMFPYLWHSLLGPHFDTRVTSPSPWSRSIDALGLEYRIVRTQREFAALPSNSNVFAVVQWMPNVLHLLASGVLARTASVGFLALSREDCNNAEPQAYWSAPALKFGLLPYGDCSLVDGTRFAAVPLGPSFEHGFPTNAHKTAVPPVRARRHLLNLMVSWTVEKPTRVQAMMAALAVCDAQTRTSSSSGRDCVVEHNDLAFKALQRVDAAAGTNLRWLLSSAPSAYIETLKQSVFTLCPHGKNPEQYRIWEALAAGSIPIVEEFPQQSLPGTFYHPSYPSTWKCVPEDLHGVLRELRAPVLFVRDWQRDLPRIIDAYLPREGGMQELSELQRRAQQWYLQLGHHLQASVVAKSLQHFRPKAQSTEKQTIRK